MTDLRPYEDRVTSAVRRYKKKPTTQRHATIAAFVEEMLVAAGHKHTLRRLGRGGKR